MNRTSRLGTLRRLARRDEARQISRLRKAVYSLQNTMAWDMDSLCQRVERLREDVMALRQGVAQTEARIRGLEQSMGGVRP